MLTRRVRRHFPDQVCNIQHVIPSDRVDVAISPETGKIFQVVLPRHYKPGESRSDEARRFRNAWFGLLKADGCVPLAP